MKQSGFRKQSYEEKLAKLTAKRVKIAQDKEKFIKVPKVPKMLKNIVLGQKQAKKPNTKTQAWYKKELDRVFSLYIRAKYPKQCYTCGKIDTSLQCGHFVSRQYLATRWDENNCRPQCVGCNIYGNGKPFDFEENLKKELGAEFIETMKASRHISLKIDTHWYIAEIDKYKDLLKSIV